LRNHDKWLKLSQTAIVLLPLGLGSEDGRFAAVVLLILLILTNLAAALAASARVMLFPGLALTALAISGPAPWLLLPFGAGVIAILLDFGRPKAMLTPANALPLALAFLIGTCTPNSLVRWLHTLAAGRP
jgi:hypothetical protein